jgi:hypothetical protein
MDLLSVRDAGERRVLPADEHAGVPHDGDQESCLTVRKAERREWSIAFSERRSAFDWSGFMLDAPTIATLAARTDAARWPISDTSIDNLRRRS